MSLDEFCGRESDRVRSTFEVSGDGEAAVLARSQLVDRVNQELYQTHIIGRDDTQEDLCIIALGGYGRQELFPHSDVDLLFLSSNNLTLAKYRESIGEFVRSLWDLGLHASQTCRTLNDCSVLHRDNLEFNVALVDLRYIAGSFNLYAELHDANIPRLLSKEGRTLLSDLIEMTRLRHAKYSNTIFHLEPNIKEVPGGFRDFHVVRWLRIISELESSRKWQPPEGTFPERYREAASHSFQFLSATRCFLHFHQERDDNRLSYELQEEAASKGVGVGVGQKVQAADWMRAYFRHARTVNRLAGEIIEEVQPGRLALYNLYRDWRSRASNLDFSAVRGKVFLRLPIESRDLSYLMRLFEFVARHGLELSHEAERWAEQALADGLVRQNYPEFWQHFCRILALPHAIDALRAMHRLGWLEGFFPEFRAIDALVVRDFYHRYTVDEHSLLAIENLYALRNTESEWERKFAEILSEISDPSLLVFSLLFHDVGKGMPVEHHTDGSLQAVDQIFDRLNVRKEDRRTVRFLIGNHLEMSIAFQRRDIFDPATVRHLTDVLGSPERLKMLCLLTYADIKSVNPEALTPWKAEMLWTLYVLASNTMARNLDSDRILPPDGMNLTANTATSLDPGEQLPDEITKFLEGLPKRYLRIHTNEEVLEHHSMAEQLRENPVQVALRDRKHYWELMILTHDQPSLFALLAGALTAWGMNIVAAEAFANSEGIILDTFRFVDLFHTLNLNPVEQGHLRQTIQEVLTGRKSLEDLMRGRMRAGNQIHVKPNIPTRVRFDETSSSHSTLLELSTQDCAGLLYQISSVLAEQRCNIEVAMIDTQGRKAIDVFYLTVDGKKLSPAKQKAIEDALLASLQ